MGLKTETTVHSGDYLSAVATSVNVSARVFWMKSLFNLEKDCWDINTGVAETISGKGHTNQVTAMGMSGGQLITCSMDDTVRYTSADTLEYGWEIEWLLMRTPIMVIGIEIRRSGSVLSQQVGKAVRITVAALNSWEKLAYRQSSHSLVFARVDVTIGSTSSAAVNTTLCNTIAGYSIRTSTK